MESDICQSVNHAMPKTVEAPAGPPSTESTAKELYAAFTDQDGLHESACRQQVLRQSLAFLSEQLALARTLPCDLPSHPALLPGWLEQNTARVGQQYRDYLQARKAGGPRQYFSNKSHACYFLKSVAPTKMVDGAWLYGLLPRWNDARFAALIRIYLEELGDGSPDMNHVVLYRKLLAAHGCEDWDRLDGAHFMQGAIHLALAHHAADFLPEVIGFNLGYEQLPLHLLITAYELDELGIDPYYFNLHVTVDNAASGHARKAVQSVSDAMPQAGDRHAFYRRMANGYRLNQVGIDTLSAIRSFDLERELLSVLAAKAAVGAQLHSDHCRIGGRTVNDWLAQPAQLPAFLSSLQQTGWIKRHQDPRNSRFWKLIQGERAAMFGVFNAYERQLMHDWIAGDWMSGAASTEEGGPPRQLSFRAQRSLHEIPGQGKRMPPQGSTLRGVIRTHMPCRIDDDEDDFNVELRQLEQRLAALPGRDEMMAMLAGLMSPAKHHTAPGLMATRMFARMLQW